MQKQTINIMCAMLSWGMCLLMLPVANAAEVSCAGNQWSVGSGEALNAAIECFNKKSRGQYEIHLTQDIAIDRGTVAMFNKRPDTELTVFGHGYRIDAQSKDGVRQVYVGEGTTVRLHDLVLTRGSGTLSGGAIRNYGDLTVDQCVISNNHTGENGGGISNESGGTLTITHSRIVNNRSYLYGGGISNKGQFFLKHSLVAENNAAYVGGVRQFGSLLSRIESSSIINNKAKASFGGIENGEWSELIIINSTISGNHASSKPGGRGGGLGAAGVVTIINSTIANNHAYTAGGVSNAQKLILHNTIIANNTSTVQANLTTHSDCVNEVRQHFRGHISEESSNNLIQSSTHHCGLSANQGNMVGKSAQLSALQANGSMLPSHMPVKGSPAIDGGSNNDYSAKDQRGFSRDDDAPDIGAVEVFSCANRTQWRVDDSMTLNGAIGCFNNKTKAGVYVMHVDADITLLGTTTVIDNPRDGVQLSIEGHGQTLNGQQKRGVRPITIAPKTVVAIEDLTVTGGMADDKQSNGGGVLNQGTLSLERVRIEDNKAPMYGGGIMNVGKLRIEKSTINNNHAKEGGGVMNAGHADVTMTQSTLSNNSAHYAGALYNHGTSNMTQSAVINNQAMYGGGVYNNHGVVTVQNSTISGNAAEKKGGGIRNYEGQLMLRYVTLSHNQAKQQAGGLMSHGGKLVVGRSILANNQHHDCFTPSVKQAVSGTVVDEGFNLIEKHHSSCGLHQGEGSIFDQDPLLAPLKDNGGGTQSHALLPDSPALNAVKGKSEKESRDQRGTLRAEGSPSDMGAVEM